MRCPPRLSVVFVLLAALLPAPAAFGQIDSSGNTAVLFSVGWANVQTDGNSVLDDDDGWYFDTEIMWKPDPDRPMWLGLGFAGSYFETDRDFDLSGGLGAQEVELSADLGLFAIEPRLTYVLLPREEGESGLFLAARIGIGLLIADQSNFAAIDTPFGVAFTADSDTEVAFDVRPAIQIGYSGGAWQVGAELSHMWAWGDFDALDSDLIEETRAGIFFRFGY